jgi:hypothetical protein
MVAEMDKTIKIGGATFKVGQTVGNPNSPTVYVFLIRLAPVGGRMVETDEALPVNREGVLELQPNETVEFSE